MKLIESKFPLVEVNIFGEYEASFRQAPKRTREKVMQLLTVTNAKAATPIRITNLFYYPARIPPSATRAVTLASLINESVNGSEFLKAIGLSRLSNLVKNFKKLATLFMVNPERELVTKLVGGEPRNFVVVDPMAGGGSIPLEAKRLGFTTIAGDYNPISYLLLRATIEFPAKYGMRLYELVNEEAKKLINYVKAELGKYYPQDGKALIYFISSEHECGAVLPLIKETALYKDKNIYITWKPDKEQRKILFEISNNPSQPLRVCPFCNRTISIEQLRRRWVENYKKLLERLLQGDETAAEEVTKLYSIAAVQISRSKYRAPTPEDEKRLVEAAKELARIAKEENLAEYLPMFQIPRDNEVFEDVRMEGLEFWHQLFTPRLLLVIYKIIKYIRNRAEELKKAYGELGVAVALYLALGFAKALNYNSLLTQWDSSQGSISALIGSHYALYRKVKLGFDFAEGPIFSLEWAFEAEEGNSEEDSSEEEYETTTGGMLPVLRILCDSLNGLWYEGRDAIYLWDAREIDKYLPTFSVDLINVDPPYYEQHDYAGITEFFWVILQTALRPVLDDLFPRDRVKIDWDPYNPEIPRNIEMHGKPPERLGITSKFGDDFTKFLRASSRVLKPDGLLVVWYSYGKLSGWEELFYRFYESGYAITKTWQVWTQSPQRRVALHTRAFFTSMVIVARPNAKREPILGADDPRFTEEVSRRVSEGLSYIISNYGLEHIHEALVVSLADGIAGITMFEIPSANPLMYISSYRKMLDKALEVAVNTVLREFMKFGYPKLPEISMDKVSRLYLMLLLASYAEKGQLKVPQDFTNRVSQVLGVLSSSVIVQRRGKNESDMLMSPSDMANRNYAISRALRLIYDVHEKLQHGVRIAEEYAKEHSSDAPLALVIVTLAWDKLGLDTNNTNKEALINVLRKVIEY